MGGLLQGQVIVNTRPQQQQIGLTELLQVEGARLLTMPAISIVEVEASEFHRELASRIGNYQIVLFISRNAVEGAFRFFSAADLPPDMQLGVIGEGTRALLAQNVADLDNRLISSDVFNSEGLLEAAELQQVSGKKILIFRGQQGRNLLGEELSTRGAEVSYCEVYRRESSGIDAAVLARQLDEATPTLVIFTSNEGMHNLLAMLDPAWRNRFMRIPWLLISERMRESALKLGHNASIIIARHASDKGIHQTICDWATQQQSKLMNKKDSSQDGEIEDKDPSEEVSVDDTDLVQLGEPKADLSGDETDDPATTDSTTSSKDADTDSDKPPKARKRRSWLGLFNLLLIIALILAAGYYWQLQQKSAQKYQKTIADLQQQIDNKANSASLDSGLSPLRSQIGSLESKLGQLEQNQQGLQGSSEKLFELLGRDKNDWQFAEVEYLMRIAQHKLILQNDFAGAAVTLQAASDKIAQTGDPGLLPVRVKISEEIADLKTRRRPDLVGATLQLAQLSHQLRALSPGFSPRVESPTSEPAEAPQDSAVSWIDKLRAMIDSLIMVRRIDSKPSVIEANIIDVASTLEDNLKLARWSVLERDASQYSYLIEESLRLFREFYNLDDAANNDFYTQLQSLQKLTINPEKPDIIGSLQLMQQILSQRDNAPAEAAPAAESLQ